MVLSRPVATAPSPSRPAAPLDVGRIRADFPILSETVRDGHPLVYLDNAATSQKPRQVIAAISRFYSSENANIHRGLHYLSERATTAYDAAREKVARFLGASSPSEIVFTRGTTEAINLVAQSWGRSNLRRGDEVLVTFVHGDFSQPYVLGGLWNGQAKLPPEVDGAADGEKPKVRTWRSPKGHRLTIHDNADNKIEIATAGGSKITLDDANGKISIKSKGGQSIVIDDSGNKITLEGKSDINVNAGGNLKVQARGNLDLEANGNVNIKGAMINLN